MAYGPHAIARHQGFVLFVRGAVPGERVEVRIRERRRTHAFADTIRAYGPADDRRVPVCPIAGTCGGCPWQHMAYAAQLHAKREIVAEQLRRIGGIDTEVAPVLPSPRVFGYRHRIKLRVENGRVGFYAGGSHDLIEVAQCALAESDVGVAIAAAARLARSLSSNLRRIEIVARDRARSGVILAGEVQAGWRPADAAVCEQWLAENPACAGLILRGRGWSHRWGETAVLVEAEEDLVVRQAAPGFSQVNPAANRILVATVLQVVGPVDGLSVLDAFAGAGNFSAALARRGARVHAIEQSQSACRDAVRNSAALGDDWHVEQGRVEKVLQRMSAEGRSFDSVLLDPPRNGAAASVPALVRLAPPVIVYVSCDPATLARDLETLSADYRVAMVQPLDMFPHTYHVETVVRCERRRASRDLIATERGLL